MAALSHRHHLLESLETCSQSSESINSKVNGFSISRHEDNTDYPRQQCARNRLLVDNRRRRRDDATDVVVIARRNIVDCSENSVKKVCRNNAVSENEDVIRSSQIVSNQSFVKNGISDKVVGGKVLGTSFSNSLAPSARTTNRASGSLRTVFGLVAVIVCLLAFNERIVIVSGVTIPGLNYGKKQRAFIIIDLNVWSRFTPFSHYNSISGSVLVILK